MKNVGQGQQQGMIRRPWVWLFVGALACVLLGMLIPVSQEEARVPPSAAATHQDVDLDRLKRSVRSLQRKSSMLQQKSLMLAAAVSSSVHAADPQPVNLGPNASPSIEEPRSEAEIEQEQITELEVRLASEADGSHDNLLATHNFQAELSAAPLDGAEITEVTCSASLCRAVLEQDSNAVLLDVNALIESTATVRRESRFIYGEEGSIKRITIYSAREGHRLNPAVPD